MLRRMWVFEATVQKGSEFGGGGSGILGLPSSRLC